MSFGNIRHGKPGFGHGTAPLSLDALESLRGATGVERREALSGDDAALSAAMLPEQPAGGIDTPVPGGVDAGQPHPGEDLLAGGMDGAAPPSHADAGPQEADTADRLLDDLGIGAKARQATDDAAGKARQDAAAAVAAAADDVGQKKAELTTLEGRLSGIGAGHMMGSTLEQVRDLYGSQVVAASDAKATSEETLDKARQDAAHATTESDFYAKHRIFMETKEVDAKAEDELNAARSRLSGVLDDIEEAGDIKAKVHDARMALLQAQETLKAATLADAIENGLAANGSKSDAEKNAEGEHAQARTEYGKAVDTLAAARDTHRGAEADAGASITTGAELRKAQHHLNEVNGRIGSAEAMRLMALQHGNTEAAARHETTITGSFKPYVDHLTRQIQQLQAKMKLHEPQAQALDTAAKAVTSAEAGLKAAGQAVKDTKMLLDAVSGTVAEKRQVWMTLTVKKVIMADIQQSKDGRSSDPQAQHRYMELQAQYKLASQQFDEAYDAQKVAVTAQVHKHELRMQGIDYGSVERPIAEARQAVQDAVRAGGLQASQILADSAEILTKHKARMDANRAEHAEAQKIYRDNNRSFEQRDDSLALTKVLDKAAAALDARFSAATLVASSADVQAKSKALEHARAMESKAIEAARSILDTDAKAEAFAKAQRCDERLSQMRESIEKSSEFLLVQRMDAGLRLDIQASAVGAAAVKAAADAPRAHADAKTDNKEVKSESDAVFKDLRQPAKSLTKNTTGIVLEVEKAHKRETGDSFLKSLEAHSKAAAADKNKPKGEAGGTLLNWRSMDDVARTKLNEAVTRFEAAHTASALAAKTMTDAGKAWQAAKAKVEETRSDHTAAGKEKLSAARTEEAAAKAEAMKATVKAKEATAKVKAAQDGLTDIAGKGTPRVAESFKSFLDEKAAGLVKKVVNDILYDEAKQAAKKNGTYAKTETGSLHAGYGILALEKIEAGKGWDQKVTVVHLKQVKTASEVERFSAAGGSGISATTKMSIEAGKATTTSMVFKDADGKVTSSTLEVTKTYAGVDIAAGAKAFRAGFAFGAEATAGVTAQAAADYAKTIKTVSGIDVGGKAGAGAAVSVNAKGGIGLNQEGFKVEGSIGVAVSAEATAGIPISFSKLLDYKPQVGVKVHASAEAKAKFEATANKITAGFGAEASGGVTIGVKNLIGGSHAKVASEAGVHFGKVGVKADGDVGYKDGKVTLNIKFTGALAIGFSVGCGVEIDVKKVFASVADQFKGGPQPFQDDADKTERRGFDWAGKRLAEIGKYASTSTADSLIYGPKGHKPEFHWRRVQAEWLQSEYSHELLSGSGSRA